MPVTLGTLAALGVGGILGGRRGLASVSLLAALAAGGAPVLAGWTSGVTASFGYVLGYALIAVVAGHATSRTAEGPRYGLPARAAFMVLASVAVYVPGLIWLKLATGATWSAVIGMGMLPFLVGDALKSALASLLPTRRS